MADAPGGSDRPDVEAIIGEIRSSIRSAEESLEEGDPAALEAERNLKANLGAANATWRVGTLGRVTPAGLMRYPVYKVLSRLIGEINNFHSHVVRVLNRLVRILEGSDSEGSEELLANARRRLTILARLGERLDEYDDMQVDARLQRIEKALAGLEERVKRGEPEGG